MDDFPGHTARMSGCMVPLAFACIALSGYAILHLAGFLP